MPAQLSLERILDVGKRMFGGFEIAASVGDWGAGATNDPEDVRTVQLLLEQASKRSGRAELDPRGVDGKISKVLGRSPTVRAILAFQRGFMSSPDGVVEPDGTTLQKLKAELNTSTPKAADATRNSMQTAGPFEGLPAWLYGLAGLRGTPATEDAEPTWVSFAKGERGVTEIAGEKHNPRVIEYQSSTTNTGKKAEAHKTSKGRLIPAWTDDRADPWCSSFVNWVMKQANYEGTNSTSSHSWKNWGDGYDTPILGSVAFIDWGPVYPEDPKKQGRGHVGFVVGQTAATKKRPSKIVLLGGNQGGSSVRYSAFNPAYIASYRVPKGFTVTPKLYNLPLLKIDKSSGDAFEETR